MPASLGYLFFSTLITLFASVNIYVDPKYREIAIAIYLMIIVGIPMVINI